MLFQKTCANCHILFGASRRVGPDITGSNRKNLDYLIDNIVDPGATMANNSDRHRHPRQRPRAQWRRR